MGITETKSLQGAVVKQYDCERCICDLIRDKDQDTGTIERFHSQHGDKEEPAGAGSAADVSC